MTETTTVITTTPTPETKATHEAITRIRQSAYEAGIIRGARNPRQEADEAVERYEEDNEEACREPMGTAAHEAGNAAKQEAKRCGGTEAEAEELYETTVETILDRDWRDAMTEEGLLKIDEAARAEIAEITEAYQWTGEKATLWAEARKEIAAEDEARKEWKALLAAEAAARKNREAAAAAYQTCPRTARHAYYEAR